MFLSPEEVRIGEPLASSRSTPTMQSDPQHFHAMIVSSKLHVAAKLLPNTSANDVSRAREILNAKINLRHSNIARIEGLVVHGESGNLALLTELSPTGSAQDLLDAVEGGKASSRSACTLAGSVLAWMREIVNAIRFLHDEGRMVHGRVEPSHILLFPIEATTRDEKGTLTAKLIGFGPTRAFPEEQSPFKNLSDVSSGRCTGNSLLCRGPENFYGTQDRLSPAADVYSLGAMTLIFLGRHPWRSAHASEILQRHFAAESLPPPCSTAEKKKREAETSPTTIICEEDRAAESLLVRVAYECVAPRPQDRPSLARVAELLSPSR